MVHSYNRIPNGDENEQIIKILNNMDESHKHNVEQKVPTHQCTYSIYIKFSHKPIVSVVRKSRESLHLGVRRDWKKAQDGFRSSGHVPFLDLGTGYTGYVHFVKIHQAVYLL